MIKLYYHTGEHTPPPFCFEVIASFEYSPNALEVDFAINYTHRDDLSPDEIEAEGFTTNDDYAWKGQLHQNWQEYLVKFVEKTLPGDNEELPNFTIWQGHDTYCLQNEAQAENFVQELIQAVLETAKVEKHWSVTLLKVDGNNRQELDFSIFFAKREALLSNQLPITWPDAKRIMQAIYQCDVVDDQLRQSQPTDGGTFLSFEPGYWFKLGQGIVSPYGNRRQLKKLEGLLEPIW
jgi:hypothetical protein